jgi:hypothetical protein
MGMRVVKYLERYEVKLFELSKTFQGHITIPTKAAIYPPRRILTYRGHKADRSFPAETLFAAILTPSCANAKANAIKKTPTRVAELGLPSRKSFKRSSGF